MAGYTFGGWYKESGCVNAWNFQTEVIGGNIMLYAKWISNNNTLNFDKNAGDATGTMNAQNIATNSTIALPLNAFVRAGYIFTGWAASQNGEVIYTNGADYNMGAQASYTLYAVWRANNNNIVFNKNDAAATGTMNKQTAATGEIINLSAVGFVKIGYTFAGWAETPAGKAAYEDGAKYTVGTNGSYTLYAVWVSDSYWLVTFNSRGGSEVESQTILRGNKPVLPIDPIRAGYVFNGWYRELSCVTLWDFDNSVSGNIMLYAKWTANKNTLNFDSNGGNGTMPSLSVDTDGIIALPSNVFTKAGYKFIGWAVSAEGEIAYLDGAKYIMGAQESYTLYALWAASQNSVVFNKNADGATGTMQNISAATGENIILSANGFTRAGYTFAGWAETPAGKVKYLNGANYLMGTESNVTLYAVWVNNASWLVTFDAQDGSDAVSQTVVRGSKAAEPVPPPQRAGYTFAGWYKEPSCITAWNFDDAVTDNTLLYAKWNINSNIVVFDKNADDAAGETVGMSAATGETIILTLNGFTRAGYTFAGWAETPAGKVKYLDGASYMMGADANYTLYAVWVSETSWLVTFDAQDGNEAISKTVTRGGKVTAVIPAPQREGYILVGWYKEPSCLTLWSFDDPVTENIILYAKWTANTNAIAFDKNAPDAMGNMANQLAVTGAIITIPSNGFTRAGYTFAGWAETAGGGVVYAEGANYTMGAQTSYTLFAVWNANTNSVIFDKNAPDAIGNISSQTIKTGGSAALAANVFSRTGYTFAGWAVIPDGGVKYIDGASYTMGANASYTLYAVWVNADSWLVSFDPQNERAVTKQVVAKNGYASEPAAPIKLGYTFNGWFKEGSAVAWNFTANQITSNITLYAKWTANKYTLTYNSNGGSGGMTGKSGLTVGTEITLTSCGFGKAGYTFGGWSLTANGIKAYDDQAAFTIGAADVTLYAVWIPKNNSIVFNANTADAVTGTMPNQTVATGETTVLSLNAFVRAGYTFAGWAVTAEGGVVYADSADYTMGTSGVNTLYAVWISDASWLVTFDSQGGSAVAAQTIKRGNIAENPPAPTRTGYTFIGWFEAGFDTSWDFNAPVTKNTLLYAKWQTITYTLSFDINGGDSGTMSAMPLATGETTALPSNAFVRAGYTFMGWSTMPYGEKEYGNRASFTMPGNDATLYAVWTIKNYTVSFNSKGGGSVSSQTVEYGGTLPRPANPTREGYFFGGWYKETGCINEWNFYTDAVTGNTTLYAKWDSATAAVYYTITFVSNGGSGVSSQTVLREEKITQPASPAKTGFTFAGWYIEPYFTTEWNFTANTVTGNVTLYAKWTVKQLFGYV